ncbi:ABC transporter permease [Actinomadura fulvescens]|uniref:ABC transporter permease n=1 Tax=Actinomadura fulvescens TaxID=46160 RepID=A0ABP6CSX9_9ACTN
MMIRVLVGALVRAAVLLAAVSMLVFGATELLPSDAAENRTGGRATDQQLAGLREDLGLDRPAWERYLGWAAGLLRGDAGRSLTTDRPVSSLLAERLPASLTLAGCGLAVAVPLALVLAGLVGTAPPRLRRSITVVTTTLAAIPQVVFAAGLVVIFAGVLTWLPPVSLLPPGEPPYTRPELLVLPALALAVPAAAFGAGLLGGAVADTVSRPHVRDAVTRGVPRWRVAVRHVVPFVLAPALRVLALITGGLLAATAVVEVLFGYTGLGELLVSSVGTRDAPVVQAVAMLTASTMLIGLTVADGVAALTRDGR